MTFNGSHRIVGTIAIPFIINKTVEYNAVTKVITLLVLPKDTNVVYIASYKDGRLLGIATGTHGRNVAPSAAEADAFKVFYLGENYQPVADDFEIDLNNI